MLVVHSFVNAAPPFTTHSTAFETALTGEMGERVDLDEISLDVARYTDLDMEEALVELMRKRQAKWQPDLVIPIGSPAAIFVAQYRDRLFPKATPVIYAGMDQRRLPPGALQQNATFVGESFDLRGMMEDMLQLAPATTNIALVVGASRLEQYWADAFRRGWAPFTNRVSFTWLNDLSLDQMLERVSRLPPRSFIFLVLLIRDATGVTHDQDEALKRIHTVANAPMNGIFQHQLGLGIVGGRLYQAELEGIEAARIAIRVLRGEAATNFPPRIIGPLEPRYDFRELQRWQISEDRLPPGSTVLFREPTVWERNQGRFIAIGALVAVQAAVISMLLLNLIKRRRAERSLMESEARFRVAADGSPVMIWMSGTDKLCTFFNRGWLEFTGRTLQQELGNGWAEGVHPDDLARCLKTYEESFEARREFTMEYRLRRHNGDYAWIIDGGTPRFVADGTFAGYVGSAMDITEVKQAAAKLRESDKRMSMAADAAHLGMWVWEASENHIWTSPNWKAIHGYGPEEDIRFDAILDRVHPEDRSEVGRAVTEAIRNHSSFFVEHRVVLPDGKVRWVSKSGRVEQTAGNGPLRVLGIAIDITERMEAEEAAREVSGKLITAQEDERRRIARDLHDDLNQRLAMLSVDADLLGRLNHNPAAQALIEGIGSSVRNLSSEVHKLSHQLHPAKLEQLGLIAATRSFCQELSKQVSLPVEFLHNEIPRDLTPGVALCVYRIVQEGLQNVVKHSHATGARVELKRQGDEIRLVISDNGHGFDITKIWHHAGLGLVGMRERVRLVRGEISFHSTPGQGARIEAIVPMMLSPPAAV